MGKSLAKAKPAAKSTPAKSTKARKPARTASRSTGGVRTYNSALAFLDSRVNYERMLRPGYTQANFNLSRMLRLLSALGNPHKQLKAIHVAGTKGKGSTCHMLAPILQNAGYKTGLFISPHIVNLRERITINGAMISEAEFTRLIAKIADACKQLERQPPTYFDILTAAAFLHFTQQECDICVIETGLGGRLDSTNVLKPLACGITAISFDHMAQLGATLPKIAEEKAGIFKSGVPVVCAPQPPEVTEVIRTCADRVGAPLRVLGEELEFSYRFESTRASGPKNRVCLSTPRTRYDHLAVPLLGEHQAYNLGLALGLIDAISEHGFVVAPEHANDGLAAVQPNGRMEVVRNTPMTVVDSAHNAASITATMRAIGQSFNYDSMVVIFGCNADKDIDGMLDQLRLGADKVVFVPTPSPRSADPRELHARFLEKTQKMAQTATTLRDAYQIALNCVTRDDLICVTGSVYLVGQAKAELIDAEF